MAQNFLRDDTLPAVGCTEQDIYDLCETLRPNSPIAGNGLQVLSNQLALGDDSSYWHQFTVTYLQLSTASTTNDIQLFQLPAGGVLRAIKAKHSAAFTGGGISAYTISVGIVGALAKYLPAFNVFQATGNAVYSHTFAPLWGGILATFSNTDNAIGGLTIGSSYSQSEVQALRAACETLADDLRALRAAIASGAESHGAATSIRIAATSTSANLSAATAGSVDVWALYSVAT